MQTPLPFRSPYRNNEILNRASRIETEDVQTPKIQTDTGMVYNITGVLLVVALGVCVVAFPYVLWLLFGTGPRSRPMRYISRQHESGTTEPSGWSEDRKKAPPGYDGAGE